MKRFDPRIVFGLLLIVGGVLALAQTMGLLEQRLGYFLGRTFPCCGADLSFPAFWWTLVGGISWLYPCCARRVDPASRLAWGFWRRDFPWRHRPFILVCIFHQPQRALVGADPRWCVDRAGRDDRCRSTV